MKRMKTYIVDYTESNGETHRAQFLKLKDQKALIQTLRREGFKHHIAHCPPKSFIFWTMGKEREIII